MIEEIVAESEADDDDLEGQPDRGEDREGEEDWDDEDWDDDDWEDDDEEGDAAEEGSRPQSNSRSAGFCSSPTTPAVMRALA